jgi:hypothetical protein
MIRCYINFWFVYTVTLQTFSGFALTVVFYFCFPFVINSYVSESITDQKNNEVVVILVKLIFYLAKEYFCILCKINL